MAIKFLSDTTHKKGDIHLDGTSSERLDLDSGVKITGQYKANGNTEYTYINMYNGANASINIGTKHSLGYISFESGNGAYTERMRITNTGKVGIGTTGPVKTLHVAGSARFSESGYDLDITNGANLVGSNHVVLKGNASYASIQSDSNHIYLRTGAGVIVQNGSGVEQMRFTQTGRIGIGTTSPSAKLHIDGINGEAFRWSNSSSVYGKLTVGTSGARIDVTGANSGYGMHFSMDDSYKMTILPSGNVGIGTASPSAKLHVAGTIKTTGDVTMSSNTTLHIGNVDLTTGSGGNTVSVEAATSSGTAMNFKTSSGTVAAYMVYQGTTTTRFAGRVEPSGNRTLDLGTDALRWRVVYCETLDSAGQHESNLQDREQPVGQYITGTVLAWKNGKNRPCTQFADHMRMGIAVLGQDSPLVQGAEPVLCTGIVEEGDYLVTSEKEGHAVAIPRHIVKEQLLFDCVIGKALQDGEGESHLIKTWINI